MFGNRLNSQVFCHQMIFTDFIVLQLVYFKRKCTKDWCCLSAAQPQLVYKFIQQTLQPGPAVSLKCIATGNPTPHISWRLDGLALPSNTDRYQLHSHYSHWIPTYLHTLVLFNYDHNICFVSK